MSSEPLLLPGRDDGAGGEAFAVLDSPRVQPGLSMIQITTLLRAHWKLSVTITVALTLVIAGVIKLLPKTYTAIATLIVNTESKDPLAGPLLAQNPLPNYVATQMELIDSPVVLLPIVDRLNLTHDRDFTAGFNGAGGPNGLRDYVEHVLANQVQVDAGRGGQLLYVSASAKNPGLATTIANTVADVYIDEDRRRLNDPAKERAERYSEELAELRAKVAAAQDSLTQFRVRNGMTDVTASANDTETQALATLETRLLDAQNQRRVLEAKGVGSQASGDEALASLQVDKLRTQISDLKAQMAGLDPTLGPKHPKVVALQSQLTATQASLDRAIGTLSENTSTQLSRAKDLEALLTKAVADQRTKVLRLHGLDDQGEKLQVELDSAQAVYKRALDGYDQTLFASVDRSASVSIVNRATPPTQPSKPKKVKLFLAGIFVSLLLGLALPTGHELLLNRRLRCRDDFERAFGIPILAQFELIPGAQQP